MEKVYVELEKLIIPLTVNINQQDLYPHEGVFLVERGDASRSVVAVSFNSGEYASVIETPIGVNPVHQVEDFLSKDKYESEIDKMRREYDNKKMELDHEFEMKKLQLDSEAPKRNEQGEWVSAKTLIEVVKTLATNNNKEKNKIE